jgi:hypothetical protein
MSLLWQLLGFAVHFTSLTASCEKMLSQKHFPEA